MQTNRIGNNLILSRIIPIKPALWEILYRGRVGTSLQLSLNLIKEAYNCDRATAIDLYNYFVSHAMERLN